MVRYRLASKEEEETSFPLAVTTKGRASVAAFASKRAAKNTTKDGVTKDGVTEDGVTKDGVLRDGVIDDSMRAVVARVAWPESGVSVLLQGYECEDGGNGGDTKTKGDRSDERNGRGSSGSGSGGVDGVEGDEGDEIDPTNPLLTLRRSPTCAKGHTMDACSYQGGR